MLDAALAALATDGLSLGLDQVRFEDVVRAADVSRTSAYRRWPAREQFVEDVLVELARGVDLVGVPVVVGERAANLLAGHPDDLRSPAGRHELFVELVRLSFQADLEAMVASAHFRTYLALRHGFAQAAAPGLRERIATALAGSERRSVARGVAVLVGATGALGIRLAPPLVAPDGFEQLARSIVATSLGFVAEAVTDRGLLSIVHTAVAFGTTRPAPWTVPAFALTSLVLGHLEPDPDARIESPERIEAALLALGAAVAGGAPVTAGA